MRMGSLIPSLALPFSIKVKATILNHIFFYAYLTKGVKDVIKIDISKRAAWTDETETMHALIYV